MLNSGEFSIDSIGPINPINSALRSPGSGSLGECGAFPLHREMMIPTHVFAEKDASSERRAHEKCTCFPIDDHGLEIVFLPTTGALVGVSNVQYS